MQPYVVRQGEYLTALAARFGFDADEVWQHPQNRELRARRPNPDILAPGDVLHLPAPRLRSVPVRAGSTNRYRARIPTAALRITLRCDDAPVANEPFVVEGVRPPRHGTTDGAGVAAFEIPLTATTVVIRLPGAGLLFPVGVGHLDPITEPSGVRARLRQLGHPVPRDGDEQALAPAIQAFQRVSGLEPTGEMDERTRSALVSAHGS
jgi:N-acetylmuramoyl-L-alanine amidase